MTHIKLIGICTNGTAVVSVVGLCRVVLQPENEIAAELLTPKQARRFIKGYNEALDDGQRWAESVAYDQILNANRVGGAA